MMLCWFEQISGAHWTGAGAPNTGLSPPAGLADYPHCLRRLTASWGRFNARAVAGQAYHYPGMRVIAPGPPRPVVSGAAAYPYPPFSKRGHGRPTPTRLSSRTAYQTYPVDLFNYQTVASPHGRAGAGAPVPIGGGVEMRLNLRLISWDGPGQVSALAGPSVSGCAEGQEPCDQLELQPVAHGLVHAGADIAVLVVQAEHDSRDLDCCHFGTDAPESVHLCRMTEMSNMGQLGTVFSTFAYWFSAFIMVVFVQDTQHFMSKQRDILSMMVARYRRWSSFIDA